MSNVHHHFDLFEYISEVPASEVAAQMASSVAFRIDTLIIQAARSLYRDIREHLFDTGVDVRAELTIALNKQAYSEQVFEEHGTTKLGPVSAIKELMVIRDGWHALASDLTALTCDWRGAPKTYLPKSIEDRIFEPGNFKVTATTKARMLTIAQRRANAFDMPEAADDLYKKNIARAEQKNKDLAENLTEQSQGVAHMFHLAVTHPMAEPHGETTMHFNSLNIETQFILVNTAIDAAERAEQWAADDRAMTDASFDMISLSSLKVCKELRAQLKQPRFTQRAAEETATEKAYG